MKINLEYIWLGGNNEFRSKNRIIKLEKEELLLDDIPEWNFDGSSTNQAFTEETEIIIKPVKFVKSPLKSRYFDMQQVYVYFLLYIS